MNLKDRVLLDVMQEHLEELDFLWEAREASIYRWDFRPLHLGRLEERMEAHLDGLREGGGVAIELAQASLEGETWTLVAAAAWSLLVRADPITGPVVDLIANAAGEASLGVRHALRHSSPALWMEAAQRKLPGGSDSAAVIWADALAFHRAAIPAGIIARLCGSGDPLIRRIAYSIRYRIGPPPTPPEIRIGVEDPDEVVRAWVLRAASRWGSKEVLSLAREAAKRGAASDAEAVLVLGAWGGAQELEFLQEAVGRKPVAGAALRGIGALGDPRGVPALLEGLRQPELAEAAGEAFTSLTGEPLGLVESTPGGEGTDIPDPVEAVAFWEKERGRFRESTRYRWGKPVDDIDLTEALSVLDLEGGRDAYLRQCLASSGKAPDFELERFARDRGKEIKE